MKKQIFTSNAEKAAKCWNERLAIAMKKFGCSQYKLVKDMNERYGTNFTQAMISDWLHVGDFSKRSGRTKRRIGFPIYTNMLIIADYFDVDVGYLTGETDMKTYTTEKVSNYIHLSENAIDAVLKITGSKRSCLNWGYDSIKYRRTMDNLLMSAKFIDFIKALGDMDDVYSERKKINRPLERLSEELGEELFDIACEYSGFSDKELESLNLTEDEIKAIIRLDKAEDECYSLYLKNEYDMKVCKYSVQEALNVLVNQLYSGE